MSAGILLLEITIKSSVLLAVAWMLVAVVRKLSAEERHLIWVLAILGVLLLPLVSMLGPRWATELEPLPAYSAWLGSRVTPRETSGEPRTQTASGRRSEVRTVEAVPLGDRGDRRAWTWALLPYVVPVHLLFAALVASRFLYQRRRIGRHIRSLPPVRHPQVLARVTAASRQSNVSRKVRVLESASGHSPWTWGVFRPAVVLPRGFELWPRRDQHHVLLHELAHIGRFDHAVAIMAQACCALYWFHPLVWCAARRIRHEAESACDDRVLLRGATGAAYAERLLAIAAEVSGTATHSVWIPAMASRSKLAYRINSILDSNLRRAAVNKAKILIASIAALALIVPVAALKSQERARDLALANLSDPEFQALVQAGPTTSDQLEQVVTTYAANDMESEATEVLVRYLTREDRSQDPDCWYCVSLLWTEDTPRQSALLWLLTDAMEQIVAQAYVAGSGNPLVPLALMAAMSKNRAAMARGIYHMSAAIEFGIDQRWNIAVVRFLNEMGRNQEARELAMSLHQDESSMYYQSKEVEQWIAYLDSEIKRNDLIATQLVSLQGNSSSEAHDFLPVSKTNPEYPEEALKAGLEGYVIVEFTVKASGRTADSRVVMSSSPIFEQAALDAAKEFLYLPRVAGGQALDVHGVRNKITFDKPSP